MVNKKLAKYPSHIIRWLIAIAVILVAVIEVLDMTIVNVALQHMMGALGANRDQITWVLTSYIVASAVVMPLTGFLVGIMGRRRMIITCVTGFLLSSVMCGLAQSLLEMVLFRVTQGLFGALLIPLSQYVILDTFPKEEHGKAMAFWGLGIVVAPILGPTLGGLITDVWDWRWIFFINVPVCLIALFMILQLIEETPRVKRKVDWLGLFWMILGIGSLQIFLDRGQTEDWFESSQIKLLFCTAVIALPMFIIRSLKSPSPIIHLTLFKDTNFAQSCFIIFAFAIGMFSIIVLQPLMMEGLMHFSPYQAGLVMAPRGLTCAIVMILLPRLMLVIDPRWLMTIGLFVLSFTSILMSGFTLDSSFSYMAYVSSIQGIGVGLFFVPISTIAFTTLSDEQKAEASGLFNFCRSIGTSVGISLSSTFVARSSQINWNHLIAKLGITHPNLQLWLQTQHRHIHDPETLFYIYTQLGQQSGMVAFINAYWLIGVFLLIITPIAFLLKKPTKIEQGPMME